MKLTATNQSLSMPIDITVNQNDKLIYIAPPNLVGGVKVTLSEPRYQFIKGEKRKATLDFSQLDDDWLRDRANKEINRLRAQVGLVAREFKTRMYRNSEVASKPDAALVTGCKQERDFVYLNLNGGDSWGYYYPPSNPEYLYNFKGEPTYLMKELLPEYYQEAKARAKDAKKARSEERRVGKEGRSRWAPDH